MPLSTRPIALGTVARFFREGADFTLPDPGVAGRNSLPSAANTGWTDLGVISDVSDVPEREELEVFAPVPGKKVLYDVVPTKAQLTIRLTLQEYGPLALELTQQSEALTGSSESFTPLASDGVKGWLEVQRHDQKNQKVYECYYFCYLKGGETSEEGLASVQVEARVLYSTLNGGVIGTPE